MLGKYEWTKEIHAIGKLKISTIQAVPLEAVRQSR